MQDPAAPQGTEATTGPPADGASWLDLGAITGDRLVEWLTGFLILILGFLVARFARATFRRLFGERLSAQQNMLGGKIIYYSIFGLAAAMALDAAGAANLKIVLGAAGVLTVALGFAAQTSASNLISGLFLVAEQAFKVGDLIQVDDTTTGYVVSIDLLSVKLRSFNNVLVRIPNETMLKSEITNLTHYPIRRFDVTVPVAYKEDLERVRNILLGVAEKNHFALDEPKPNAWLADWADSAIQMRFCVWFAQDCFWEGNHRLQEEIKRAFDAAGIELPFPHRSLYAGSASAPFPVRVVNPETVNPETVSPETAPNGSRSEPNSDQQPQNAPPEQ